MTSQVPQRPISQKPEKIANDSAYLAKVRKLPCVCCGRSGPSEAHHCRDLPDHAEKGLYARLPGAARKSHDRDAIPLCELCHWMFHMNRTEFHKLVGKDYSHIGPTRAAVSDMEVDF